MKGKRGVNPFNYGPRDWWWWVSLLLAWVSVVGSLFILWGFPK